MHVHSKFGLVVHFPVTFQPNQLCASRACNRIASESLADLRIHDSAVRTYAASLDVAEVHSAAEQPRLPIRFDSQQSEVRCRLVLKVAFQVFAPSCADLAPVCRTHFRSRLTKPCA